MDLFQSHHALQQDDKPIMAHVLNRGFQSCMNFVLNQFFLDKKGANSGNFYPK